MAKVLLVEDDNNLREIYEARLQAEGYEISSAMDGEQALVVAKQFKPDLVISDVMMPKISGFEMLDILRNTPGLEHTRVIMLTALGQAEDKSRADALGADRYLVKSQVTLEDIVKAAHEILDGESPTPAATATSVDTAENTTPPVEAVATDTPVAAEPPTPDTTVAVEPLSEPVAEPPVEPAPEPTAEAADTAATEPAPQAPEPEPETETSPPESETTAPSSNPAVTDANDPASMAGEQASVNQQIEDFIANAPAEPAPAADPEPTAEVATTEAVETAEASSASATDDKLLADAANSLNDTTAPSSPQVVQPEAPAQPAPSPDAAPPSDSVTIANKKVIQPIDEPDSKPNLDELLAKEEAKAATETAPAITTSETTAEPTPELPHQPGQSITPTSSSDTTDEEPTPPGKPGGIDPHDIAL